MLRPKQKLLLSFSLLGLLTEGIAGISWGSLNQTYPTSPVTFLRMEAYTDAISTVAVDVPYQVPVDTWTIVGSTWSFVPSWQIIKIFTFDPFVSTDTINSSTMTIQNFMNIIGEDAKLKAYNKIMDGDMEEYMVFPATSAPKGWSGWCLGPPLPNGKQIPVTCP